MFTNGEVVIEKNAECVKIETLYYTFIWYSKDPKQCCKIFLSLVEDFL